MRNELILLLEKHCGTIRAEAEQIDVCMQHLGADSNDEQMQRAIYLVHKIKGGSGALGFMPLSDAANRLEYALRDLDTQADRDAGIADIRQLSAHFQQEVRLLDPATSALHQSEAMNGS